MKVCYIDSMGRLLKELKMRKVQTTALILAGDCNLTLGVDKSS